MKSVVAVVVAGGGQWFGLAADVQGRQAKLQKSVKILVGAYLWVYAATQPEYDIYPILEQIFTDMSYVGLDGIELMRTALHPASAVERRGELSKGYQLPIIGTSFGAMWNRQEHAAILKDAELVIKRFGAIWWAHPRNLCG